MSLQIALLRGINVSGHNPIRMEALRRSFESLGYGRITTYLQSGNVVFVPPEDDPETTASHIAAKIREDFGWDVPVLVLTAEKLLAVASRNPLFKKPDIDPAFLHVTFLSSLPLSPDTPALALRCGPGERIVLDGDVVYLYCPGGYGNTKLSNTFLETKLGVKATTRNWKTVTQLLELVKSEK